MREITDLELVEFARELWATDEYKAWKAQVMKAVETDIDISGALTGCGPCADCGHAASRHEHAPPGDPGWTDLTMFPCDCGCDGYQEGVV